MKIPQPPQDYAERVYAGVLGKIIGVYLGRPFEGWTYERIAHELGEIRGYVHHRLDKPLVVTDDDISGTFTFVRALEDYDYSPDLSPAHIGETWLNYLIEGESVLWWGGLGNSTEHTAYLRLKRGLPAPLSGAASTNGKVVAEQIGAQIFIDAWAMLCPGDPDRAADLARRAASVSHEAIYGAQIIAAMEASAFVMSDLQQITDEALRFIPAESVIARLIHDVREWRVRDGDWHRTRERISERYGYQQYGGNCHIVPNHALIHLGLQYGDDDFSTALSITNTSGWDTDCNSGNVGAFLGIKLGLAAFSGETDWRSPVADRMYLSTADGGRTLTDALTESVNLTRVAARLRGENVAAPKADARFHFSLPGSVQGWAATVVHDQGEIDPRAWARVANGVLPESTARRGLAVEFAVHSAESCVRAMTSVFVTPDGFSPSHYHMRACPTLYGGQTISARLVGGVALASPVCVRIVAHRYRSGPVTGLTIEALFSSDYAIGPGEVADLRWTLPDGDGSPFCAVGLVLASQPQEGSLFIDWFTWSGPARVSWQPPIAQWPASIRSWVPARVSITPRDDALFHVVANEGRGLAITGQREWTDYTVVCALRPHMAEEAGLAVRVQGLERYYAVVLTAAGRVCVIKRFPGVSGPGCGENAVAAAPVEWILDRTYELTVTVMGNTLSASLDGRPVLSYSDGTEQLPRGAIALVACEGRVDIDAISVRPVVDDR
ncbi:MAG: ADP-ribosylglycohydrolase family protein [Chloroflexi bacterium]|nr:ADP-ribosylglycohydrolase family protein [Chloroflexota bacterium]